jgi:hypothetical protein
MEAPFAIEYEGLTANVSEHELQEMRVFRISFTGPHKPLVINVAEMPGPSTFSPSMPKKRKASLARS